MILRPATLAELREQLAEAHAGGRSIEQADLSQLSQLIEHTPQDLTVTVQTGMTLAALESRLRVHGQWLPVDPPRPETTTLAEMLDRNLSGPHRFGFGTIREHLLGLTVAMADGRLVRSGGKVVKNVAGYDLCKLFVGSHGTLGVPVEATFKLLPLPEQELFVAQTYTKCSEATDVLGVLMARPITPVILDLHHLNGSAAAVTLVLGLAGAKEDVAWQLEQLSALGFLALPTLDYQNLFDHTTAHLHSILPSRLAQLLNSLEGIPWLARAGNGLVYAQGGPPPARPSVPTGLQQRVKDLFDPKGILPKLPW